jgi:fucose permease
VLALGLATFAVFGGLLVLVGATQGPLAASLGLDLAQTGLLAAALSAGLGFGIVAAGPIADRLPRRPAFAAAAGLAAACLLSAHAQAGYAHALAAVAGAGLAAGALETLVNAGVADRWRERAARPLALVHLGATLGAVAGPPLLGAAAGAAGWPGSFRALGAGFAALALAGGLARLADPPSRAAEHAPRARVAWWSLAPCAAALALYVGVETALTAFAVPYARALGLPEARGVAAISALWLGLLVGRAALLAWRGPLDERVVAATAAALALGAAVGLGTQRIELAFAAVGLCLGGIFPVLIAVATARVPEARGTAAGIAGGAGAAGGSAASWLTGALGDALGMGLAAAGLCAWCVALAGLAWWARPREAPGPGTA